MNDLFSAGMETSRTTVVWLLVIMLREPRVAQKVMEELSHLVPVGTIVTMAHRPKLPYIEAANVRRAQRLRATPLHNWLALIIRALHRKCKLRSTREPNAKRIELERFLRQ
ncbi:unnamed protein product, partial [Iphiclides podalirius]